MELASVLNAVVQSIKNWK